MEDQTKENKGGRPRLFDSPEKLEAAIEDYFNPITNIFDEGVSLPGQYKREIRKDPTITGLAYHLGFESRQSFYDYEEYEEFSYIIKKARLRVEMGYEQSLRSNNCTGAIFALKNMGWKDKTETDITTGGDKLQGFQYLPPYETK